MKERGLIIAGFASVVAALTLLLLASASAAILIFVFLAVGAALLLLGLARMKRHGAEQGPSPRPAADRGDRVIWLAGGVLAGLAVTASVVAAIIAVGDAIGHAVSHLVFGVACLLLYAVIAAAWHPQPGSAKASIRGMALLVLGIGALGSFIESLGGAGYDAANVERRIEALASLHPVGVLVAPVAFVAIPIGLATVIAIAAGRLAARLRTN